MLSWRRALVIFKVEIFIYKKLADRPPYAVSGHGLRPARCFHPFGVGALGIALNFSWPLLQSPASRSLGRSPNAISGWLSILVIKKGDKRALIVILIKANKHWWDVRGYVFFTSEFFPTVVKMRFSQKHFPLSIFPKKNPAQLGTDDNFQAQQDKALLTENKAFIFTSKE